MNSHEAGRSSIERAALILEEARHLQVKDACNLALRRAHEAAELAP
jgi:hypothetical protein